jgi:hypothetical protein
MIGSDLHSRYTEATGSSVTDNAYSVEYVHWLEKQISTPVVDKIRGDIEQHLLADLNDQVTNDVNSSRQSALVYFNGNYDSVLHLTDIERYDDGSIKSGYVENGCWYLKIINGMVLSFRDYARENVMNSLKVDTVVEKDYEEYNMI